MGTALIDAMICAEIFGAALKRGKAKLSLELVV